MLVSLRGDEAKFLHDPRHIKAEPALDQFAIPDALNRQAGCFNRLASRRVTLPLAWMDAAHHGTSSDDIIVHNHFFDRQVPGAARAVEAANASRMPLSTLRFGRPGCPRHEIRR